MEAETTEWKGWTPIFYILDEALEPWDVSFGPGVADIRLEHQPPEPSPWPYLLKYSFTTEFTSKVPLSDTGRTAMHPLFAELLVRQLRTVHRLARQLGIRPREAQRQFDQVQRVLEETGIGDGYGCLTLSQPVRPPVIWRAR
ncbi:hypothetical protein [Streptomyces sp. NBC_00620]|uniref:hypothetical protein n=1 Tax=Streptomyces sp. NBC_00620 TaxID=2903666 RepID=UPI002257E458|nr:hypothetical protein [Streptomyces sp. NBC_00620]MCX4974256.1 hypothetical protein [Streptomyces sp. NBC_00620]